MKFEEIEIGTKLDTFVAEKLGWENIIEYTTYQGRLVGYHAAYGCRTMIPQYSSKSEAATEVIQFINQTAMSVAINCHGSTYSCQVEVGTSDADAYFVALASDEPTLALAVCKSFFLYMEYINQ